jgi:aspartate/methionine/tyrosine aminotransferase
MAARQVRVTPGTSFHLVPGRQSRHIRVCFGGPRAGHQARRGFEIIRELMNAEPEEDFTPVA